MSTQAALGCGRHAVGTSASSISYMLQQRNTIRTMPSNKRGLF